MTTAAFLITSWIGLALDHLERVEDRGLVEDAADLDDLRNAELDARRRLLERLGERLEHLLGVRGGGFGCMTSVLLQSAGVGIALADQAEERTDVRRERLRLLQGGEVSAAPHVRPAFDVVAGLDPMTG